MTSIIAAAGAVVLGASAFNNIQSGSKAFDTPTQRTFMHLSHFLLTSCASEILTSNEAPSLFWLTLSMGGAALYAAKFRSSIQNAENRYQTMSGRTFETIGNIGGSLAILQVGKCFGLSPLTTAYYTCMGLYQAISTVAYYGAHLVKQVGLGFLFGRG